MTVEYNIFRWYRANWGRYTQADPLGLFGDPHPFSYAGANPVVNLDPLGLDFTNNSSQRLCYRKDDQWDVAEPKEVVKGDVDGVVAPKGRVWKGPGGSDRVFKWIECFHGVVSDGPKGSLQLRLVEKTTYEKRQIEDFIKECGCLAAPDLLQRREGGPKNPWGPPPGFCP